MGTQLLEPGGVAQAPEADAVSAPPEPKRRGKSKAPRREKPPKGGRRKDSRPKGTDEAESAEEPLPETAQRVRTAALRKGLMRLVTKNYAVNLALVVLLSLVAVIFLLSLTRNGRGNFTISLSRTDMYKYGIELAEAPSFSHASNRLEAAAIRGATNITVTDLPPGLEQLDGSNNGPSYIAYTFYVRNNGTADLDYQYRIDIKEVTRQLDEAVRVAVYLNGGQRQIYAKHAFNGGTEPGTVPFATDKIVDSGVILDMEIGAVDKYTILVWIEGNDPECTDERLGGMIKLDMAIEVLEDTM